MLVDDSHKPFPDRVVVKAFHKTFLAESPQVRRELLQSVINLIHEKTEVTMLFQDLIMQVDSDQTFPLVDCQLRYLTDEGKLQIAKNILIWLDDDQSDAVMQWLPQRFGRKSAGKISRVISGLDDEQRTEVLRRIFSGMSADDHQVLVEARLKYSKSTVVQTDPFHPLVGCHQLEQRLLDELLQQLLSSMQTEQPRIVGRLLELMDPKNRLDFLSLLCDRNLWSQADLDSLVDFYNPSFLSLDKPSQLDTLSTCSSTGVGARFRMRRRERGRYERPQANILTFEATMKTLGDIFAHKLLDDEENDRMGK
ncbi:MAG: hypothetical protein SGPRY_014062, partial [Prymnesium sp.]